MSLQTGDGGASVNNPTGHNKAVPGLFRCLVVAGLRTGQTFDAEFSYGSGLRRKQRIDGGGRKLFIESSKFVTVRASHWRVIL